MQIIFTVLLFHVNYSYSCRLDKWRGKKKLIFNLIESICTNHQNCKLNRYKISIVRYSSVDRMFCCLEYIKYTWFSPNRWNIN